MDYIHILDLFDTVMNSRSQEMRQQENDHMSYTVASSIQGYRGDILLCHLHKDAKGTSGTGRAMEKNLL